MGLSLPPPSIRPLMLFLVQTRTSQTSLPRSILLTMALVPSRRCRVEDEYCYEVCPRSVPSGCQLPLRWPARFAFKESLHDASVCAAPSPACCQRSKTVPLVLSSLGCLALR